ncbi:MAG: purine-binding chemotaxis protein CheW [Nocardioidaceae bacterium]|jgi:purine-binding chemotaxis protein CheW|nr:purine-binding chemotaxis protein CheW [Nocardioidaceae bacterium]
MESVLVPVHADLYAIPMDWVREVVNRPKLTRLVTAPAMVLGLFNLRGEIVPLMDTASLLGVGHMESVAFAVVLETLRGPVGLSASAFPEQATLDEPVGPSELAGSIGTYGVGERLAVLLDVPALLDSANLSGVERPEEPVPPEAAPVRRE